MHTLKFCGGMLPLALVAAELSMFKSIAQQVMP